MAAAKYVLLTEDGSEEHELVLESLVAFTWRPVWGGWNEAVLYTLYTLYSHTHTPSQE